MDQPRIFHIADDQVDARLDARLRELLCACFTQPQDAVFRARRFFIQPPGHRWCLEDGATGILGAHVAVHDRLLKSGERRFPLAGIAEVCVRPAFRGRGWARLLLREAHAFMAARGAAFAMLFGRAEVYRSSGYVPVDNPLRFFNHLTQAWRTEVKQGAMARPLSDLAWPSGELDLGGPVF